jgi:hypothetical protein
VIHFPYWSTSPTGTLSTFTPLPRTLSPESQVVSQVSDVSRILRTRGSPRTSRALNLRQIVALVQNDRDILPSAS